MDAVSTGIRPAFRAVKGDAVNAEIAGRIVLGEKRGNVRDAHGGDGIVGHRRPVDGTTVDALLSGHGGAPHRGKRRRDEDPLNPRYGVKERARSSAPIGPRKDESIFL